jgi:glycine oxidase
VNVTIIGAGVAGCAVAYELASRGARVRVVDPRGPGRGATRASAGMLAPHIEGHIPQLHALGVRSLALYDGFIDRLRSETDQPIEYERTGTLQVAGDERAAERLRGESARLSASGVANTLLSAREVRSAEHGLGGSGTANIAAGLLIPDHGYIVVSAFVDALVAGAERHGARFTVDRATGVHGDASGAQVTTMAGTIDSDAVVIAAGSWTPELAGTGTWPPPVKPIRGQLLHLRTSNRVASRVLWGSHCYLVPWRNGSVLVGATSEDVGFHEWATAGGVQDLVTAATALIPELRGATFEEVRVGLRPMTPDELPIIGRSSSSPQVFYATGHFRNGVLLAPLTAMLVGDALIDNRSAPELDATRPSRFGV